MLALGLWCAAALIAYTFKGFSGFGPALIVVPVLSVLHSPGTALGTSALIDVVVGAVFLIYLRLDREQLRLLSRMLLPLIVGTVIGSVSVSLVPRAALLALVGASVLILAIQLLRTGRPGFGAARQLPLNLSCFLAGLSGGLIGVSGPFMVAGTARFDKAEMRRLLVAVFLIEGVVRIVTYTATGTITSETVQLAAVAVPAIAGGMALGIWLHTRVTERRFTTVVGWFLIVVAGQALIAAFVGV